MSKTSCTYISTYVDFHLKLKKKKISHGLGSSTVCLKGQNQCFSKTKFESGSPHHMEPGYDIFSPFWTVVQLLYLVSAKGFWPILHARETLHPIVEISTIWQIEYLPNSF